MKICFLTTSYPRFQDDDAGIFVKRLAQALAVKSEGVLVISPLDGNEAPREWDTDLQIRRVRYKLGDHGIAFGAGIFPNLKRRPWMAYQLVTLGISMAFNAIRLRSTYDLIVANWIFSGFVAFVSKFLTGKPYLYVVRGAEIKIIDNVIGRFIFKVVVQSAKHTICVSEPLSVRLKEKLPSLKDRITYIPNGVSLNEPNTEELSRTIKDCYRGESRWHLLFIGTVIPRKNVEWLVRLMAEPLMIDFDITICGRLDDTAYVMMLNRLIDDLRVGSRIHLVGEVSPAKIPLYLKGCDAYLTSSTDEGTPNSVLEALVLGKVVFASNIAAHKRIIEHGMNGYLFSLDNSALLASQIKSVIADSETARRIESKARESVKERTWTACAQKYWEVIGDRL